MVVPGRPQYRPLTSANAAPPRDKQSRKARQQHPHGRRFRYTTHIGLILEIQRIARQIVYAAAGKCERVAPGGGGQPREAAQRPHHVIGSGQRLAAGE